MEDYEKKIKQMRKAIALKIEEAFGDTPRKGRIEINSMLLKELLFDETYNIKSRLSGVPFLLPVWSGPFLEHIDLSSIDFSNVVWWGDKVENGIVYKNTNAKIMFDETQTICNCDFSGTDLSKNHLLDLKATRCNFSETNIEPKGGSKLFKCSTFNHCTFSGLAFQSYIASLEEIVLHFCNVKGTGLNICFDFEKFSTRMTDEQRKEFRDQFKEMLELDMLTGCYINDIFVPEDKERKDFLYNSLVGEPEEMAKTVLEDISNQIEMIKKNC